MGHFPPTSAYMWCIYQRAQSQHIITNQADKLFNISPHLCLISSNCELVLPHFLEENPEWQRDSRSLSWCMWKRIACSSQILYVSKGCLASDYPVQFLIARVYYFSCLKAQWQLLLLSLIFLHVHINSKYHQIRSQQPSQMFHNSYHMCWIVSLRCLS